MDQMKNILSLLFTVYTAAMFSQDLTSKDGESILPQEKDWSIGIDATRLIKNASFDFVSSSQALQGKYFKDAKTAYRIGVRIGINNYFTKERVLDRVASTSTVIAYPAAQPLKTNTWQRSANAFGVSFGIEKRKGNTRLQGVYGVEGAIYVSTIMDKFSYGNGLNADPSAPVTVTTDDAMRSNIFGLANNIDTVPQIQGVQGFARVVERKRTPSISIGARVFIGAEYFFLPKMSIGGEFGWGVAISSSGRTETTLESIGQSNIQGNTAPLVRTTTIDSGTSNHTVIDTDNSSLLGGASASLRINLYF